MLFDMDGTLVDSDAVVARTWTSWARRHGVDPDDVLRYATGIPGDQTIRHFRPRWSDERVAEEHRALLAVEYDDTDGVVAAPGAHEAIAAVVERGLPWAVVTSADRKLSTIRLAAADITVPLVVSREDISAGKPDPEGYLAAAERLGVEPEHCLVVEDAGAGVVAGEAAGMRVAGLRGVGGDIAIADLHELAELLRA